MKKCCLITTILTGILIISFVIYRFQVLNFSTSPTYITGYSLGVKGSIKFFYIDSSISASFIQVQKIEDGTNEKYLLENYEGYDNMIGYGLRGDTMTIYLRKGYWIGKQSSNFVECDTFHLNINNVKWKLK